MSEEWKNCIEDYEISNFGNCRKKMKNGVYKNIKGSVLVEKAGGYRYFQLNRDGKRHNYKFHHLVAKYFIGERLNNLVIDHIDRNKLNNNVNNLRYVTQKENCFNYDRVNTTIPQDDPKRKNKLHKIWRDKQKINTCRNP